MISFDRVTKRYGERLALQDVTWRMDEGECVVILGHSAAGKTTLLHLITHETLPTSGTVTVGHFSGGALTRGDRALLRRTLGVVDEDFRLLGDRSVFENVSLAVRIAGRFDDAEVAPRVQAVLSEVGLRDRADRLPHELSYGERQRCAIARAIVNRPPVVIADEPTAALEAQSATAIIELLTRIHREGAALLVGTTRPEVAAAFPGRVLVLEEGRLREWQPGTATTTATTTEAAGAPPPEPTAASAPTPTETTAPPTAWVTTPPPPTTGTEGA